MPRGRVAQLVLGRPGPERTAGAQQANEHILNERGQVDSYIILQLLRRRGIYTPMTNDQPLEIVGGLSPPIPPLPLFFNQT